MSRVEKLKKLGLSSYEAQAYLALIKLGIADAGEISLHGKIPLGRIYGVLSNLEESYLVRAQETRPRRYMCIEVTAGLERLSKNKKEELKQKEEEIDALVNELAPELSSGGQREPDKSLWTVAKGGESLEHVRECISDAQKEILFFFACRNESERIKKGVMTERYSQIIDSLNDSLKKGVNVKVIFNKDVDISSLVDLPAIKQLFMYPGDKFNARLAAIPSTPFNVIDGETVILRTHDPLNPEELSAVANIRDTKLAQELAEKFFAIWEKAEDILKYRVYQ